MSWALSAWKLWSLLKVYFIGVLYGLRELLFWHRPVLPVPTSCDGRKKERTALVVGASGAIGSELCRRLDQRGFRVIAAAKEDGPGAEEGKVHRPRDWVHVDLSRPSSVESAAEEITRLLGGGGLSLVVQAAGLMMPNFGLSEEGLELQLAVNVRGPLLLTKRLSKALSADCRLVFLSSATLWAAEREAVEWSCGSEERYSAHASYAASKLALALAVRRLASQGLSAVSAHPGVVPTPLYRHVSGLFQGLICGWLGRRVCRSAEEAGSQLLWLCLADDVRPGVYYENGHAVPLPRVDAMSVEALYGLLQL